MGTARKQWKRARPGTKRANAAEVMIANEGKPMEEVIKLIMAKLDCSRAEGAVPLRRASTARVCSGCRHEDRPEGNCERF